MDILMHFAGCFCVYSDGSSFEYIRDSLEKTLLSNLEQEDRLPFQGLPLVIVFAACPNMLEKELIRLKEEGSNLAASIQCPFLEVSKASLGPDMPVAGGLDSQFAPDRVEEALRALIENIRHRSGLLKICKGSANAASTNNTEPDIR